MSAFIKSNIPKVFALSVNKEKDPRAIIDCEVKMQMHSYAT